MKAIQTTNLTKYYGKARGIIDLNLSVSEGDFFGFIGPNGAGKSTTIRTLLGLISASSGSARILDLDVNKQKIEVLSQIGYLPSETLFYHGMRVRDVLKLSADLHKKDCSAEASQLCKRFDLDPSRKVDELSLGNRKKVGIICAMQHRPRLYIMDEPTSGLDPLMQREFFSLLKERNDEGATIFLSSHVLSEVQRYCTHAAIIREGRLLLSERVEKLSHTDAKRVTIRGLSELPELPNVKDVRKTPDSISFLYGGKTGLLVKTLSDLPIADLLIAEPDLEEIFMHFYTREDI